MKNKITFGLIIVLISCNSNKLNDVVADEKEIQDTIYITETKIDTVFIEKQSEYKKSNFYIEERLPQWFLYSNVMNNLIIQEKYKFDNRINPLYLETDFNGDGVIDIAIPIIELKTEKIGFAIVHGESLETHIIGAGTNIINGLSDDMNYIGIWKVNREKIYNSVLDDKGRVIKKGSLINKFPSLQIEKSEVGGGQIYWDGKEYVYLHQTC